jgi:hypothetical protein
VFDYLNGVYYVYAEYNPFFPYGPGWWLYAIPIDSLTDERDMSKWARATWLNYDWRLDALFNGIGLPKFDSFRDPHTPNFRPDPHDYCLAFMKKCPAGIVCEVKGDGRSFLKLEDENIGDYLRRVRQRQLDHITKAQEENEKEREHETNQS